MKLSEFFLFQQQTVRDLAWLIGSENLLAEDCEAFANQLVPQSWSDECFQHMLPWLLQLDARPQILLDFLAQKPTRRLGLYFENLLEFLLNFLPDTKILFSHYRIYRNKQTFGEFDYIWQQGEKFFHWEAAVKFYLLAHSEIENITAQWQNFLGPNAIDNLDKKIKKLFQHQLPLSHQYSPIDKPLISQALVKGYLFYPLTIYQQSRLITGISATHHQGWWLRYGDELPRLKSGQAWLDLPRMHWLSPAICDESSLIDVQHIHDYLQRHFTLHQHALLLVAMTFDQGQWREVSRGFVVWQHWPNRP